MFTHADYLEDPMYYIQLPVDITRGRLALPVSRHAGLCHEITQEHLDEVAPLSFKDMEAMRANEVSRETDIRLRWRIRAARQQKFGPHE
jgi:hypothetical protein